MANSLRAVSQVFKEGELVKPRRNFGVPTPACRFRAKREKYTPRTSELGDEGSLRLLSRSTGGELLPEPDRI